MHRTTRTVAAAIGTIAMIVLAVVAVLWVGRTGDRTDQQRLIRVSGAGEVYVAPDHATIIATAEGRDANARIALREADERMERVLEAARELGVGDDDLSTDAVRTRREHDFRPDGPGEPGDWIATSSLRIELDDLDLVGRVLAAVSAAGAQQVDGPNYTVRDPDAAYQRALDKAMANARAKADAIAEASGASVGAMYAVQEAGREMPGVAREALTAAAGSAADSAKLAVTPGETELVRASVTVSFTHD